MITLRKLLPNAAICSSSRFWTYRCWERSPKSVRVCLVLTATICGGVLLLVVSLSCSMLAKNLAQDHMLSGKLLIFEILLGWGVVAGAVAIILLSIFLLLVYRNRREACVPLLLNIVFLLGVICLGAVASLVLPGDCNPLPEKNIVTTGIS